MNFQGTGKRLTDIDLPRLGAEIGVGEDEIHAFLEVEALGRGFDKDNRPKMLFEPHVFYRKLSGHERDRAIADGVAYKKWGTEKYPRDSYPRLITAMKINQRVALESCSWGLGQVMGFNALAAGFSSAHEMVEAFKQSEARQLEGAISFIKTNSLDDDLRRHDWDGFAKGYNGSGYKKHGYQIKLAKAFAKWQKIPDTEWKRKQAVITTRAAPDDQPQAIAPSQVPASAGPKSAVPKSGLAVGAAAAAVATGLAVGFKGIFCSIPLLNLLLTCGG